MSSASRPSDRVVNPTRSANRTDTSRRSATGAADARALDSVVAADELRAAAQLPQNFSPGSFDAPQDGHETASGAAHSEQNLRPLLFSVPQFEQTIRRSRREVRVREYNAR